MYISFRLVSGFLFFFSFHFMFSPRVGSGGSRRWEEIRSFAYFLVFQLQFQSLVVMTRCSLGPASARRTRSLMKNRQQKVQRKRLIVSISHSLIQLSVEGGFRLLLYQTIVLWQKFFILEPFFEAFKLVFSEQLAEKKPLKIREHCPSVFHCLSVE